MFLVEILAAVDRIFLVRAKRTVKSTVEFAKMIFVFRVLPIRNAELGMFVLLERVPIPTLAAAVVAVFLVGDAHPLTIVPKVKVVSWA